jgi:RNA polymerase sigma-70 factor (ECF subfamily)
MNTSMDRAEEPDLVRSAKTGDLAAWEALVQRHQEALFRYVYLQLHDAEEAKDVAQDALVRAFRSLDRFDERRALRPWLLRIARNLAHNRRRKIRRNLAALARLGRQTLEPATPISGVEGLVDESQTAERLWSALQRLKPQERQVIELRYYLGLPIEEAAEALGIPTGTLKSRSARALTRLRGIITREYPDLLMEADK